MQSTVKSVLNHRVVATAVSGIAFLAIVIGLLAVPERYVVEAQIQAPEVSLNEFPAGEVGAAASIVRAGPKPGSWQIRVEGGSRQSAERAMSSTVKRWRSKAAEMEREQSEPPVALQKLLVEQRQLLESEKEKNAALQRRIEALDAAALAVRARLGALKAESSDLEDPVGTLLTSLKDLQATLAEAFPPEHPQLVQLSREIAQLVAASASQAELVATTRQVALFRTQMKTLLKRYAPNHPEVQRKTAELRSMERRLRNLHEGAVPIVPVYGEPDVAKREKTYWTAELRALEREKGRLTAELSQTRGLELEIAALEAEAKAETKTAKPSWEFRVVSGPTTRAVSELPRFWMPWALAASFLVGALAALTVGGSGNRVWHLEDLPAGPWEDRLFYTPPIRTSRTRAMAALRATMAALPWVVAFSIFASSQG